MGSSHGCPPGKDPSIFSHRWRRPVSSLVVVCRRDDRDLPAAGSYGSLTFQRPGVSCPLRDRLMHEMGHALACRSVGARRTRSCSGAGGVAYVAPPQRPGPCSGASGRPLVNVVLGVVFFVCESWVESWLGGIHARSDGVLNCSFVRQSLVASSSPIADLSARRRQIVLRCSGFVTHTRST